jgi:hypothetical protein
MLFYLPSSSCKSDATIFELLNSKDKEDIILGSFNAGNSGSIKFVPLLLKDSYDPRRSTNLQFKGVTVYQAKMTALRKIFKQDPPIEITHKPDSLVIKFYIELAKTSSN